METTIFVLVFLVILLLIWAIWATVAFVSKCKSSKRFATRVVDYVILLGGFFEEKYSDMGKLNFNYFREVSGYAHRFDFLSAKVIALTLEDLVQKGKILNTNNPLFGYLGSANYKAGQKVLQLAVNKAEEILNNEIAAGNNIKESEYLHFLHTNNKDAYDEIYKKAIENSLI